MKLWRLTRAPYVALDGAGPARHGARYTSPGLPVVNFASEAGLAVLVALRYLPKIHEGDLAGIDQDYVLGWTEVDAIPERFPEVTDPLEKRALGDAWLESGRSLLAAVRSAVLPEADVVMMNPSHPDAARVPPLVTRPFSFADCLHLPPMLDRYREK
jgi:RES domain-containing protein